MMVRAWLAVLVVSLPMTGCGGGGQAAQTQLAEAGAKFLLAEEPAEVIGILDYREANEPLAEVTLLGKIGGGNPTWSPESAMFLVSDPSHEVAAGDEHQCKGDNCPFCKGKSGAEQAQAVVMLTDENGQVPAVDARKLLPLEEGQMVVVRGRPEINAVGQLVVHARGVYVRR
jgi:hypothetical protein